MSSLFTGLMDAPRVSQARLRPECARYYPGLKRDAWYPVLGRGGDEFGMFLDRMQRQGIERRLQMTADPIGADQHQGTEAIQRRLANLHRRDGAGEARSLRRRGQGIDLIGKAAQGLGGGTIAIPRRPAGAPEFGENARRLIAQIVEKIPPALVDRAWAFQIAFVLVFYEVAVGAIKK